MLRNLLGFANKNLRLINDDEPSYQIQEFAGKVFEAFRRPQIGKKTDEEKKELFFTDFDKILNSTDLKTNKNLKDEIYDDLISDATSHLRRINTTKQENDGRRLRISGVRVRTAQYLQDNETDNEIDSIQIRLLIYDLRHRSEQQIEGSTSSFGSGWPELWLSPEITSYLRLGLSLILTPSMQVLSKLPRHLAAESGLQPEAISALLPIKPPIQMQASEASMEELEPLAKTITVEDINRDKVAEFEKFLEDDQLNCSGDNIQKIFALHELYEAYKPYLINPDNEIQGEISVSAENLGAFKDQISELIFKKESSESPKLGFVPRSSLHEPRVKLDPDKLNQILTFLNQNQESEKIDSGWETSNPPLDLHDDSETIVKNVELFKKNKKVAITEKLASWYLKGEEDDKIQEAFIAYEAYANATSIQDKQNLKAIILFKLTEGDQDVSKNLGALEFLKNLNELNKYHPKAKQEKPNEYNEPLFSVKTS